MSLAPDSDGTKYLDWPVICPVCRGPVCAAQEDEVACGNCETEFSRIDGIWRFIVADRLSVFEAFLDTYTRVRIAEGRGSYGADVLRDLPACPPSHALAGQWRIRAASYRSLIGLLRAEAPSSGRILDLGAGTGWLSHRLALEGYDPLAVDISVDRGDGLGAARHFDAEWPRMQAELDRLPLADAAADVVIYNASFHYCTDQAVALGEALRVLADDGLVIIVDSPVYSDPASGTKMLAEQQAYFERLIGERSDALPVTGFLTWAVLTGLAKNFGLQWQYVRPWYGLRWAVRPLLATLRRQREPAKFVIAWARKRRH